ncbi:alpha/beta hydrolase [Moraxella bovis]|uniref:alpha/beta hydrolase n=1 Tax=Moraxella bovis TaxID=476 RepID=UPI002227FEFB|nr:alpha/beta hydrolase [Moraxella bovis]UYZ70435.1 alpha/beta hydrolase [Moraxella bovis]UYZ73645.1 alpha/beta hydrolase [Moraxella bovis]UZA13736.1 alpha/beta hydrolase [Moraxella bovis]UZA27910.1 alpha/beta hydrolase [Moraxella bovis]UZA43535.1 alpha/beta hydrolase [Moraxella bovis]
MTLKLLKSFLKYITIFIIALIAILLCFYLYLISGSTKQGDITWHSCYRPAYWSWFSLPPSVRLQCATVNVPVDYTKPYGKTFAIPLTRLPTKGSPVGELLLLNGGPGGHSLDMSMTLFDDYGQTVKDNFNVLGYAPRGVAPSAPAIDCGGVDETDEQGNTSAKAYMDACIQHTGADILPFISSKEVVKDLDSIRTQLGVDVWSMVGYSYGTKLVAKYAEHYPTHLRAGVADGVVDTSESLFTILKNQYKGSQIAFDAFIKSCQDTCIFDNSQDPNTAFINKLADISAKNLTDKNGDTIDSQSILAIINENINDSAYWADMMTMLGELDRGETGEFNTQLRLSEFGEKGFSKDALSLVNCADSAPKLSRDDYIKQAKIIDSEVRYDDIKERSDDDYLDACYYWQWQATDDLNENLITNDTPNLLFVAQKYDLATPLANAVNMAKRFDDTLIYTPYHGHTVSLSGMNACVDGYVVQYLLDPKIQFDKKVILCE